MASFLDLIASVSAPFLENKVIVYILILLVLGVDALYAAPSAASSPQPPALAPGEYFVLWGTNVQGNPNCSKTDGSFFLAELGLAKKATPDEVNKYCPINNSSQPCAAFLACDSDPNSGSAGLGVSGGLITGGLNLLGDTTGNEYLANLKIFSWEIFIVMLIVLLLIWLITASTRS